MCIPDLSGNFYRCHVTGINILDELQLLEECRETNIDITEAPLEVAEGSTNTTSIQNLRDVIREVCKIRRPGRPPVYRFNKPNSLLNEEERKFMAKIIKRRIRQNNAYRRRKARSLLKHKETNSDTISSQSFVDDSSQDNSSKYLSPELFSETEQSLIFSDGIDEEAQLRLLWSEEQWVSLSSKDSELGVLRFIFQRTGKVYERLNNPLKEVCKCLAVFPGPFDVTAAHFVVGVPFCDKYKKELFQPLLESRIIIPLENNCFQMGPLEKSFILSSTFVKKEPNYHLILRGAKRRFIEYFMQRGAILTDQHILRYGTARDVAASIYKNDQINIDQCIQFALENEDLLDVKLLSESIHLVRYCLPAYKQMELIRKVLIHQELFGKSRNFPLTTPIGSDVHLFVSNDFESHDMIRLKFALGEAYCEIGDEENGEYMLWSAIETFHQSDCGGVSPSVILPLLLLASLQKRKGYYNSAIGNLTMAVNMLYSLKLRASPLTRVALTCLIILSITQEDIEFVKDSLPMLQDIQEDEQIPEIKILLGIFYKVQGKKSVSSAYFSQALSVLQEKKHMFPTPDVQVAHCGEDILIWLTKMVAQEYSFPLEQQVTKDSISYETDTVGDSENQLVSQCSRHRIHSFCFDFTKIHSALKRVWGWISPDSVNVSETDEENEYTFKHPFFCI